MISDTDNNDGHGIGRWGGGHGTGTGRRLGGRQEVRLQGGWRVEGAQCDHENTLPLGGRVLVDVQLYGERGRGGGDRQRQAPRSLTRVQER